MKAFFLMSLFALLLSGSSGNGQQIIQPNPATKVATPVNCSRLENAPGCNSFNEMLAAGDKSILLSTSGRQDSLVCFRENEDVFLVLTFSRPDHFVPQKKTGFVQSTVVASYERYNNGQSEDGLVWVGNWIKGSDDIPTDYAALDVRGQPGSTLYVDSSEASVSFDFSNLEKAITHYSLKIRRSTLRFTETFSWPESMKANAPTQQSEMSGHCIEYGKSSPPSPNSAASATP